MIAIVDYGMGNLRSVQKALQRTGAQAEIVTTAEQIDRAEKIVLPGVGAFRDAIGHLRDQGLIEPVKQAVQSGRPFLGICLGFQLLFDVSYEDGEYAGLGVLPGEVLRFNLEDPQLKVPHMGWNRVHWHRPCPLFAGLTSGQHFYFVHSYYVAPRDASLTTGVCDYGGPFCAMVWRDNLFAAQFHPEKSQAAGLTLLRNFADL